MAQSKNARKSKGAAQAELHKKNPQLYAYLHGIEPGCIIWAIHPGCPDGQYLDIKAHPFMLMGWGEEGFGILLPLSKSKADSGKFIGTAIQPAKNMEISAGSFDCMIHAPIERFWKPAKDELLEFSNKAGFLEALEAHLAGWAEAKELGKAKLYQGKPMAPAKLNALKSQAIQAGRFKEKQGKQIARHAKAGCSL